MVAVLVVGLPQTCIRRGVHGSAVLRETCLISDMLLPSANKLLKQRTYDCVPLRLHLRGAPNEVVIVRCGAFDEREGAGGVLQKHLRYEGKQWTCLFV